MRYAAMLAACLLWAGAAMGQDDTQGTWAFDPPRDSFGSEALLDLRSLNEAKAGETGFIRLSADGNSFVRGDGQPIRFWSTGSSGFNMSDDDMKLHARHLAKLGVNMVRLHVTLPKGKDSASIVDLDEKLIDGIQKYVGVCRDNGIYVTISPFYPHLKAPASWQLEGYDDTQPWGLIFFNEKLQDAWKAWVKELYTRPNPYTGRPLKDETAIAIVQVLNEDSLLFWTSQAIKAPQQRLLCRKYGEWLTRKYGSIDKAIAAWGGLRLKDGQGGVTAGIGDDPANGIAGMYIIWHLTQPANGNMAKRLHDQLEFIADLQHTFYADAAAWYRKIGCRQLTNASNWKAASDALDDVERYTYTACDVIAVNRYTGGSHEGQNNGYRIDPGHLVADRSVLRNPLTMPTNLKNVLGHPMIITETTWVQPNLYQSEGAFLAAAYMSLGGVDTAFWFHAGHPDWLRDPRRKFWHVDRQNKQGGFAVDKWSNALPTLAGTWPANALMFRRGYIREGEQAVVEQRTMKDLFDRKQPVITESTGFDTNRDAVDLRPKAGEAITDASRLAFLVGQVQVSYDRKARPSLVADMSKFIDATAGTVRSNTRELEWNWKTGLCTIDAPKAQGACGFLRDAGGKVELSDVTIESSNEYAAVQLVSMDDRPLKQSQKILVQVGTTARLTGWKTEPATKKNKDGSTQAMQRIVATGYPPYRVADTHVTLSVRNAAVTEAVVLDVAGYPRKTMAVKIVDGLATITLPEDAMYVILR